MFTKVNFVQKEISVASKLFADRITYLGNLFRDEAIAPLCESGGLDFVSGQLSRELLGLPDQTYFFYDPVQKLLIENCEDLSMLSKCSLSLAAEVFLTLDRRTISGSRFGLFVPSFIRS
ncbi:MAG: hypothetical protein ACO4CS_15765 [bacterium]